MGAITPVLCSRPTSIAAILGAVGPPIFRGFSRIVAVMLIAIQKMTGPALLLAMVEPITRSSSVLEAVLDLAHDHHQYLQ